MYRREFSYWDLQESGLGDVERYPVSEALASFEGRQLLGMAFDELAKRQQELIAAEERGRAIRKLSAQTHAPINHLHHIDRNDPTILGLEEPPWSKAPNEMPPAGPAASRVSNATEESGTPLSRAPASPSTEVRSYERRSSRPPTVEGSLIRSGVRSTRSEASAAAMLDLEDTNTEHASQSIRASEHERAVGSLMPDIVEVPTPSMSLTGNRIIGAAQV